MREGRFVEPRANANEYDFASRRTPARRREYLRIIKGDVSSVSFRDDATRRRRNAALGRARHVSMRATPAAVPVAVRSGVATLVDLRVRLGERHLLREHLRDAQIAHFVPVPVRLVEHHGAVRAVFGFTVVRHVRDEVVHARRGSPVRPSGTGT